MLICHFTSTLPACLAEPPFPSPIDPGLYCGLVGAQASRRACSVQEFSVYTCSVFFFLKYRDNHHKCQCPVQCSSPSSLQCPASDWQQNNHWTLDFCSHNNRLKVLPTCTKGWQPVLYCIQLVSTQIQTVRVSTVL